MNLKEKLEKHLQIQEQEQSEPKRKFKYSYNELKALEKQQEFLLNELIPLGEICTMIGTDGIGKSGLAIQLGMQFALNLDFCGLQWNQGIEKKSLFIATEDGYIKFSDRLKDFDKYYKPEETPDFDLYDGSEFDSLDELIKELDRDIKENGYKFILIDTAADVITSLAGQEINDFNGTNKALNPFKKLASEYQCTILFVHHVAKSKLIEKKKKGEFFLVKDDTFGSSRLTGKPRLVLALTHDKSSNLEESGSWKNYLHVAKSNVKGTRKFEKNAFELEFNESTGVHEMKQLVNISEFEQNYFGGGAGGVEVKDFDMKGASIELHQEMIDNVFENSTTLEYNEFKARLIKIYGMKHTYSTAAIAYLQKHKIIKENLGIFTKFNDNSNEPPF